MNEVVMVTGAGRGIGRAYSDAFVRRGYRVALVDKDPSVLPDGSGPEQCAAFAADLMDWEQVSRVTAEVEDRFGRIDVLVNNVGGFPPTPFLTMSVEDWHWMLRFNLDTTFYTCKAVAPGMVRRQHGRIINTGSSTIFKGNIHSVAYIAAKSGVVGLTRVLATELGPYGITVNCVAPGLTDTPGARAYTNNLDREPDRIARRAIRRKQEPKDLVGLVCFLASPEADFITGQTIVVDGGDIKH